MKDNIILDFSGVAGLEGLAETLAEMRLEAGGSCEPIVLDFKNLEGTNCYCDPESEAEIRERLRPYRGAPVWWIDTGDYHYLSLFHAESPGHPYNLLVLDHHPDMQGAAFGDILSCGGWVRTLLERDPGLRRVILAGVSPGLVGEAEGFGDRVAVIPERGWIAPEEILAELGESLPVFVSVDKDVLRRDDAATDWDQGSMTAENLTEILRTLTARREVCGTDICGGIPEAKGGRDEDFLLNAELNRRLAEILLK